MLSLSDSIRKLSSICLPRHVQAILATSLESICPAAALKENEQVFSHPGSLENLRKFLLVILEELVKYKIWPVRSPHTVLKA